jgi:glyoxylase-like metal-dependent hydrolase (beta-lactamase superfamily II)
MTATITRPRTYLETTFPGLHATPGAELPFARDIHVRAFLLEREHGNILVYSAPTLADVADRIDGLGGASWQYLGHWHEAMFLPAELVERLGTRVVVHAADIVETARRTGVEPTTFSHRGSLGEGFEIIPIPGHTPGATAFLFDHDGRRFLFTGDSLYLRDGEWVAAVLDSSDRAAYVESLDLIRTLDFDVLVPWAASAGEPYLVHTDPEDARRRIGTIIDRIWRGEDH